MTVREYIGARYAPLFMGEWDETATYEPLSIVSNQGNSYTSRQYVPTGIPLTNETFWAETGNYNAQVEAYREEVLRFDGRITANAEAISTEATARENADTALDGRITANANAIATEATARADADTALNTRVTANANAIATEATARADADTALNTRVTANANAISALDSAKANALTEMIILGDSWSAASVTDAVWGEHFADKMRLALHNYAVNGARFTGSSNVISSQLASYRNDTSFSKDKVKYVIVLGGVNDYRNGATKEDLAAAVIAILNGVKSITPNAKVLYAANFEYPYSKSQGAYWYNVVDYVKENTLANGIALEGYFPASFINTDNYFHLTQRGQRYMASILENAVEGGDVIPRTHSIPITIANTFSGYYKVSKLHNGVMWSVNGTVDLSQASQTTGTISSKSNRLCYADGIDVFATVPSGTDDVKVVGDINLTQATFACINPTSSSTVNRRILASGIITY